jgi:hypothetical protein
MSGEGSSLKKVAFAPVLAPDKLSAAFEHSITWEDDLWRADPVDVAGGACESAPQVRRPA